MAVQPACGDDGYGGGISVRTPFGAEAAGDFAEDDAGSQGPLAIVVGGGDIAAGDEEEEIAAAFADAAGELSSGLGVGRQRAAGRAGGRDRRGTGQGGVLEFGAALADADGAVQELLKARCETGVAGVDGVLRVAQQMGQAKLALMPCPAWAA